MSQTTAVRSSDFPGASFTDIQDVIFSVLNDTQDVCCWSSGTRDGIVRLSSTAAQFFGLPPQETAVAFEDWLQRVVAEEDRATVRAAMTSHAPDARFGPFRFRVGTDGGTRRCIEQRGRIVSKNGDGTIAWLSQDVTRYVELRDQRETAALRFAEVFRDATLGIAVRGSEGKYRHCNTAFCTLVGYTQEELSEHNFTDLVHPDDVAAESQATDKVIAGQIPNFECETRFISKSGKPVWVHKLITPLPSRSNQPPDILAVIFAIEDRRRTEEALWLERDKLKAVIENVGVGIGITDPAGHTLFLNAEGMRIHGFESVAQMFEQLSDPFANFELRYPDGREMPFSEWPSSRAFRGEFVQDYDVLLSRRDSELARYIKYSCGPIRNQSGDVVLFVFSMTDLTEVRRMHEALLHSQKLGAMGELASGIVHDFNNQLAIITGNLELARPRVADDDTRKLIDSAHEAATIGAAINRRLLSATRRRSGQRVIVDVNERIVAMEELVERIVGSEISLVSELSHDLWPVRVDPGELDGALLNLVNNSCEAMKSGGLLVLRTFNVKNLDNRGHAAPPRKGDFVQVIVKDTGAGMSSEAVRRAGEPFFTTKGHGRGTGLGLTGVFAFAERAGGHIDISSSPGAGTEVSIFLPRATTGSNDSRETVGTAEPERGRGELILVVEDDDQVREVTMKRLESLGYAVEEACTGEQAIALVESGLKPALILSDIVMPGSIDGFQLAEYVASRFAGIGVVLTTGYQEKSSKAVKRGQEREMRVLEKPYALQDLAGAIRSVVVAASGSTGLTSPTKT